MHNSFNVPGKPKKETKDGSINFSLSAQMIVSFFMIIIILLAVVYRIGKEHSTIDYSYLDKFTQYLIETSDAYDNSSKEFMKSQYEIWMSNNGYADIIIGADGELESIFTDNNLVQSDEFMIPNYGVYIFSDDNYNYLAAINKINSTEGSIILVRSEFTKGYHTTFSTKFSIMSENKYKIYDSKDMTIEFTDYNTIIIENGPGETYIDKYISPDYFVGEYLPIYSY